MDLPHLTGPQLDAMRSTILGPTGILLIDHLFRLRMGGASHSQDDAACDLAIQLGLIEPSRHTLTQLGWLISDSAREYAFWRERGRQLPSEGQHPNLSCGHYAGRRVLEIGCGAGVNLMTLTAAGVQVTGVEPVYAYRQMAALFAEREGLAPADIVGGQAEALPFDDGAFDVIVCISSYQYIDVVKAFREMRRVLAPGGELQIVGGTLDTYLVEGLGRPGTRTVRGLSEYALTIANTLWFSARQRRLVGHGARATTRYPIYPPRSTVLRQLRTAGFDSTDPVARVGCESVFISKQVSTAVPKAAISSVVDSSSRLVEKVS
jgi:ubiquinone/menaquinone biosynthesis C-methylase UbiE